MRTLHLGLRVHDLEPTTGLSHFVIQVASMDATLAALSARGISAELVQWPPGHADGMSSADWAE